MISSSCISWCFAMDSRVAFDSAMCLTVPCIRLPFWRVQPLFVDVKSMKSSHWRLKIGMRLLTTLYPHLLPSLRLRIRKNIDARSSSIIDLEITHRAEVSGVSRMCAAVGFWKYLVGLRPHWRYQIWNKQLHDLAIRRAFDIPSD